MHRGDVWLGAVGLLLSRVTGSRGALTEAASSVISTLLILICSHSEVFSNDRPSSRPFKRSQALVPEELGWVKWRGLKFHLHSCLWLMGPCLFISEAGCMMGNRLDHRTETADSVAHLASAQSIRQQLDRPTLPQIQAGSSQSCPGPDDMWQVWGHLPLLGITHLLNRGLYCGWCKPSEYWTLPAWLWQMSHMSAFRLGAGPQGSAGAYVIQSWEHVGHLALEICDEQHARGSLRLPCVLCSHCRRLSQDRFAFCVLQPFMEGLLTVQGSSWDVLIESSALWMYHTVHLGKRYTQLWEKVTNILVSQVSPQQSEQECFFVSLINSLAICPQQQIELMACLSNKCQLAFSSLMSLTSFILILGGCKLVFVYFVCVFSPFFTS